MTSATMRLALVGAPNSGKTTLFNGLTGGLAKTANYAGTTPSYDYTLFGASWDVNQRITLALDWQQNAPKGFPAATGTNVRPTPRQSTVFLHWQATF